MDDGCQSTSIGVDIVDDENDLMRMPRQYLIGLYKKAITYIGHLDAKAKKAKICSECKKTNHVVKKLLMQEKYLLGKLAIKEKEVKDNKVQYKALHKSLKRNSILSLNCSLQDPSANILIQKFHQELKTSKTKLLEKENELKTFKFTPDSKTGKMLMAKCRMLHQENDEISKEINSGCISNLEYELSIQKDFIEEVRISQLDIDEYLQGIDEDAENSQNIIVSLQDELVQCNIFIQNKVSEEKTDSETVNGTKKDASGCIINTPSVSKENIDSKTVHGTKRDASGSIINIPSVSKIGIPTLLVESKPKIKSNKQDESNDIKSTNLNDNKSNSLAEGTEYSQKSHITHKRQCKSNHHKIEEKCKKGENMACSSGELIHKKTTQNN